MTDILFGLPVVHVEEVIDLPDKMSDLLSLALDALEACEADPNYFVYMGEYHKPADDGTCSVCLAGSAMAKVLGADKTRWLWPDNFDDRLEKKLRAIDRLRQGRVYEAAKELGIAAPFDSVAIPYYSVSPEEFKAVLRGLAAKLKELGA